MTDRPRSSRYDVIVVGGGIVGLATAVQLLRERPRRLAVLEAEARVAAHQSSHNSGVIHAGLYYAPGSLKATLCATGRDAMYAFCAERGIPCRRTGKIVLAADEHQASLLAGIRAKGEANGLRGIIEVRGEAVRDHEPFAAGVAALVIPQTGVVDFATVARAYADEIVERGGEVHVGSPLVDAAVHPDGLTLITSRETFTTDFAITCAGLQADRVTAMFGMDPGVRIVPFRGEYVELLPHATHYVRALIYPVPDPRFPFLGTHLTRLVDGRVEAGPNAVLAWSRAGYARSDIDWRDLRDIVGYGGFRRFLRAHYRTGLAEFARSLNPRAVHRALQALVPEIALDDFVPGRSGVRAQAMAPDGRLIDDFHLVRGDRMIHVLNAPSPAATASLAIGARLAGLVREQRGEAPARPAATS